MPTLMKPMNEAEVKAAQARLMTLDDGRLCHTMDFPYLGLSNDGTELTIDGRVTPELLSRILKIWTEGVR